MLNFLEKFNLDNKKIILLVLASLVVVYLDFSFFIKSQLNGIKDITPKIIELKSDIGAVSKDLASMQDLKAKQDKTKQSSTVKAKKIIREEDLPDLLEYISGLANKNNIKIMQIKPSKELKTKDSAAVKEAPKFSPILISLDLICVYHNLGLFLTDIENAGSLMGVEALKIESVPTNYQQERVNLVLRTYVKK